MIRIIQFVAALALIMAVSLLDAGAPGQPSAGAEGMAGAQGTFEFTPDDWMQGATTWWKDSDGFGGACLRPGRRRR